MPASARGVEQRSALKIQQRRRELAEATIRTLSEIGYARTSLREIAQNSDYSHGVLHYYFRDKADLIVCSVQKCKESCITRYDGIITTARTYEELEEGFLYEITKTLRDEAPLHRLWFDLRSQALFDESFRDDVIAIDDSLRGMFSRLMRRLSVLAGKVPSIPDSDMYPLYDGLFQQALLKQFAGESGAAYDMKVNIRRLLRLSMGLPQA